MIGSGKANVRTVVSIAQAQCLDTEPTPAVKAFASLGGFGQHSSKEERDLHRWLKNLHGVQLETYNVRMKLLVRNPVDTDQNSYTGMRCINSCFFFSDSNWTEVSNSLKPEEVDIPVLLPHEILDAVARAGSTQARNENIIVSLQYLSSFHRYPSPSLPVCHLHARQPEQRCCGWILGTLFAAWWMERSSSVCGSISR